MKNGKRPFRIRGGSGLGDAIYVRPIAEHFKQRGERVVALTDYADVFLDSGIEVAAFARTNISAVAHYVHGKGNLNTTQWDDVCASAGVRVPLRFSWKVRNHVLIEKIFDRAKGRPIVVVHGGRAPMGRKDGFGMELLPSRAAFDTVLAALSDCFTVQVGKAPQLYPLKANQDLNGSTRVSDLLDLASVCAGVVAQCSFAIPLAEVFDKPMLAIWSSRVNSAKEDFVRQTVPKKVLSSRRDSFVVDDWERSLLEEGARAFRNL